jgi:ABC-2 type transport system ATP-binding protein
MMNMELKINRLTKRYANGHIALKDLTIELKPGILGLLGPNGAGKSTLMKILSTVTQPTGGQVLLDGVDIVKFPNEMRKVLGYLPQDFGVYPNLSAVEFLQYIGALKGISPRQSNKRIDELMELLNLKDASKKPIGSYSGGMRQRVGIAQAIMNHPKILIVDEPTVGLDPEERVRFRNLLSDLSGSQIIIFSTHIVSDVESIASDIVIMNKGSLIETGTPETLIGKTAGNVWDCVVPHESLAQIRNQMIISNSIRRSEGTHVRIISDDAPMENAQSATPGLEDAYLYFLNQSRNRIIKEGA